METSDICYSAILLREKHTATAYRPTTHAAIHANMVSFVSLLSSTDVFDMSFAANFTKIFLSLLGMSVNTVLIIGKLTSPHPVGRVERSTGARQAVGDFFELSHAT